jgi:ABC-type transporter MlaC component
MRPSITDVSQEGPDKAIVRVSIGWEGEKARPATFKLLRTRGGWRIADVSSTDEPSLLGALETANRKARAKH